MKLEKLQPVRDGHRKVIENLFKTIETAKENSMLEIPGYFENVINNKKKEP